MTEDLARKIAGTVLGLCPPELRLHLQFLRVHRRWGNFRAPRTFSEKVQYRKLYAVEPRFADFSDKVLVKHVVSKRLGSEWVIPTLWAGPRLPPLDERNWPLPFVIKANHGSGWNLFVREARDLDWPAIERMTSAWLARDFAPFTFEEHYRLISRQLLVEPLIGEPSAPPPDFKFFAFDGEVAFIQVDTDRFTHHRRCFYDPGWHKLPFALKHPLEEADVPRPRYLAKMIRAAEALARDFDFARVDFYELPEGPKFGEITFMPGSGFEAFHPSSKDEEVGRLWRLSATARRGAAA
jgi:hypothetical protein